MDEGREGKGKGPGPGPQSLESSDDPRAFLFLGFLFFQFIFGLWRNSVRRSPKVQILRWRA